MKPEPTIRSISPEETYPLRHAVLWPDKPLDYAKVENDAEGQHLGAFVGGQLVSVISWFVHGAEARFRKFATAPDFRSQGIGTRLLRQVVEAARQAGAHTLWCDARQDALSLYQRFGMQPEGPVFYKGPVPYQRMRLTL